MRWHAEKGLELGVTCNEYEADSARLTHIAAYCELLVRDPHNLILLGTAGFAPISTTTACSSRAKLTLSSLTVNHTHE